MHCVHMRPPPSCAGVVAADQMQLEGEPSHCTVRHKAQRAMQGLVRQGGAGLI